MKKTLLSVAMVLGASMSFGQILDQNTPGVIDVSVNSLGQTVVTSVAEKFMVTTPAREWPVIDELDIATREKKKIRKDFDREGYEAAKEVVTVDPVVQTSMGMRQMRAPIQNWQGQGGSGYPPDPSGAAGPNHYVQAVNTTYRIYNKTGGTVAGPFSLATLWTGSSNMGDPIVMYDRHADRWFISQFNASPNRILIAISETNDPTGSYYAYSFTLSAFPDYPKYSIWWDGYYMSSNSTNTAVVFERDKMLAGDPTAQMVALSLPSVQHGGFRCPLPADADGPLPPNGTPCYFFHLEDNAYTGVSQDQVQIYEMTTDWTTTSNTSVSTSQQLALPSFDAVFSGGWSNIAQPGTSQGLDAIMGVFMYRAQHRREVNYNSVILTHAVDLGSNRSGIRWYELRDAHDGVWSVFQTSTYAPDNKSRWMSSAAMDDYGNIGMAYSISDGTSTYPGLRYTGRLYGDAPGDMSFTEQTAVTGSGSQTFTDRYGDYGQLTLDPDGETFWYTGEYLQSGNARTRIFSFNLRVDAGLDANPYLANLNMNVHQDGSDLIVKVDGIYGDEDVQLDLIAMNGSTVSTSLNLKPVLQTLDGKIDISNVQSGAYFVRVGNGNFQKVERIMINR